MGGECRRGYFQQRGTCGSWDGAVASHLPRGCNPGWPHRDYRTDFRPCTQNTLNLGPLSIFPFLNASNSTICGAKDKIFSTNFYLWICEKKLNRMFNELFLMHPNFDSPLGTQLLFNLWAGPIYRKNFKVHSSSQCNFNQLELPQMDHSQN